ncbi:DUF4823 domain-containing protein [Minwuia sp.]|uniref:DUF4823 domain-containing protein n=1 Tax=Minwuia sp. TaxID=2493630 RepID=UPI003A946EDB
MTIKIISVIFAVILLTGCSNKFKTDQFTPPPAPIAQGAKAIIMMAEDGQYGGRQYFGSGRMLSEQTQAAVSKHLSNVAMSTAPNLHTALSDAPTSSVDYVIEPKILHWEDRATEWSGRPDRITIKIVVWDAKTGKSISTSLERASSKWATLGGDHPQDLLPQLLENWSNRVF